MEKISRKEFYQTLQTNATCMFWDRLDANRSNEDILNEAETLSYLPGEWRTVIKTNTTGVQFSDGSWCRHDQKGTEYTYWKGINMVVRLMRNDKIVYRNIYLVNKP